MLRDVLLQGHLYATKSFLAFFAYLPDPQGTTLLSSNINYKSNPKSHKSSRYWAVLRDNTLSLYSNPSDLYFPTIRIDLRYTTKAEIIPINTKSNSKVSNKIKNTGFPIPLPSLPSISVPLLSSPQKSPSSPETETNSELSSTTNDIEESCHFNLYTDDKTYHFVTDSPHSAKVWIVALQKQIFQSKNLGDFVKIIIPFENIIDLEEIPIFEVGKTLKIKIIEDSNSFVIDDYFFTFFKSNDDDISKINLNFNEKNNEKKELQEAENRNLTILDTTKEHEKELLREKNQRDLLKSQPTSPSRSRSRSRSDNGRDRSGTTGSITGLLSRLRSTSKSASRNRSATSPKPLMKMCDDMDVSELFNHRKVLGDAFHHRSRSRSRSSSSNSHTHSKSLSGSNFESLIPLKKHITITESHSIPDNDSPKNPILSPPLSPSMSQILPSSPNMSSFSMESSTASLSSQPPDIHIEPNPSINTNNSYGWSDWVKHRAIPKTVGSSLSKVSEMWSANHKHYSSSDIINTNSNEGFRNILPNNDETQVISSPANISKSNEHYRSHFALLNSESLIASYYSYLQKTIPIYGKIYLGLKNICYRSLLPKSLTKIKMILPYDDIENVYKEKGFRFGYSGLVIVIKGHEEIFFEFSNSVARDDCELVLLKQLDNIQKQKNTLSLTSSLNTKLTDSQLDDSPHSLTKNLIDTARLYSYEDALRSEQGFPKPIIMDEEINFSSLKPKNVKIKYRFTMLTIGSRGDVQPYIALGKRLIEQGHSVKIVTHLEFKDWIEENNLKFSEIAGNPTKLMQLMIEHGSLSVSFIRDSLVHFKSWIDELLESSWIACQDSDVLIESPSAMAGIHIAEALQIPYFRAFTMPWTRTRAYPHAFIVPEQKMGGSYNYLTYVMFENIFWKGISNQVNKWRINTLKLEKTNLDLLQQNKVPFLYMVSPSVFPPSVDFSDWIKVTGYWFLNQKDDYKPPADLLNFISKAKKDNKKLIYIGFGSIVINNPSELTKTVLNAVVKSDVRCILSKGWSDRVSSNKDAIDKESDKLISKCAEVYSVKSIPHDWLFPQIDAAVHHGGCGTTGASLRYGLPTVIKPFFADQFFYANRVEDLGVGVMLKKLTLSSLSKAIKQVTLNQRIIMKAKHIGEKISNEDGVGTAILAIYRDLEYAKSLIKAKKINNKNQQEESKSTSPSTSTSTSNFGCFGYYIGTEDDLDPSIDFRVHSLCGRDLQARPRKEPLSFVSGKIVQDDRRCPQPPSDV